MGGAMAHPGPARFPHSPIYPILSKAAARPFPFLGIAVPAVGREFIPPIVSSGPKNI